MDPSSPSADSSGRCAGELRLAALNFCSLTSRLFLGRNCPQTSINSADMLGSSSRMSDQEKDSVPMPIVSIDQDSDTDATIVQLSFGDRLGALVDTMRSLKNLGLDVTKGTVTTEDSVVKTKFFIMRA
ncbi:hypothetical protein BHM03_00050162 [Ensete ventricosum]|nr:hypothetical protein BHM03_00050162 [Ensete ventricosum]